MAKSKALGTILKQGLTTVASLTSISIPGPVKTEIDITDFSSVAAEFMAGMPDYGEVTLSGFFNYSDAGQTIVRADAFDVAAGTKAWTIAFVSQSMQFIFNAYVKSYVPDAGGPNDAYKFTAVLRVTGAVTTAVYP
jgi:hypothetical protein